MLAHVQDAVVAVDNEHRISYWNEGAKRLYGYGADEVLGRSLEEVVRYRWHNAQDEAAAYEALSATGFWMGENIHRRKDGTEIYVESSVSVVKDSGGADAGLLAAIRDVTGRKLAEKEKQRLVSLVENSHEFVGLADLQGNVTFVNEAGRRMVGLDSAEEVRQTRAEDYTAPEDHALSKKLWDSWRGRGTGRASCASGTSRPAGRSP